MRSLLAKIRVKLLSLVLNQAYKRRKRSVAKGGLHVCPWCLLPVEIKFKDCFWGISCERDACRASPKMGKRYLLKKEAVDAWNMMAVPFWMEILKRPDPGPQ